MEAVIEKKCPSCKSMHVETTKCCVSCIAKAKARYDLKKEEILQKSKEYSITNKEKIKQNKAKYYKDNKEYFQNKSKLYNEEHKEELQQQRKNHYEAHKEEILQKNKHYRDDEKKDEINERRREKRADDPERALENSRLYSNSLKGKCRDIVSGAKQRGISVDMTKAEIMRLTDMSCFYCGNETIDKVMRNGIDRMNNAIGYTPRNSVSCCWN
jgi:hypothetical protein